MTGAEGLRGQNFFLLDGNLRDILARLGALDRWSEALSAFGAWVGDDVDRAADYTDRRGRPVLESHDRHGDPVNRIVVNPAWEAVSREVYRRGVVGLNYLDDPAPFAVTFAMGYMLSQADVSLHCPVTMTGAVAYVLDRFAPAAVKARYLRRLTRMDGAALSGGTWATELTGGSDVGATTTTARRAGDHVLLNGLKWFVSNPAGGLALATARPEGAPDGTRGLGLYLVPTHLEDGAPNPMRLRRLKDKLGTVGVPTAEIDLIDTRAVEVAPPPDGFKLMMEALEFSRIHNAMGSAGLQRRAFLEALTYASGRRAFGETLTDFPMVQDELLAVMVQIEAGCALAFEAARAFDAVHAAGIVEPTDPGRTWLRLATALAKYQTAEEAIAACRAAIEIIGGNGYTYDYVTPRLLRDAQVMTVWEGPANVQALEILRLLGNRYPGAAAFERRVGQTVAAAPAGLGEVAAVVGAALAECREAIALVAGDPAEARRHARRLLALMADTLAAALLLEEATDRVSRGDMRKALVARLFVERRLRPPARRGIGPGADWAQRYFAPLVGYAAIEPLPA